MDWRSSAATASDAAFATDIDRADGGCGGEPQLADAIRKLGRS